MGFRLLFFIYMDTITTNFWDIGRKEKVSSQDSFLSFLLLNMTALSRAAQSSLFLTS